MSGQYGNPRYAIHIGKGRNMYITDLLLPITRISFRSIFVTHPTISLTKHKELVCKGLCTRTFVEDHQQQRGCFHHRNIDNQQVAQTDGV